MGVWVQVPLKLQCLFSIKAYYFCFVLRRCGFNSYKRLFCRYSIKVSIRDFHSFDVGSIPTICSNIHRGENWYSIQSHKLDSVDSISTSATNSSNMEEIERVKKARTKAPGDTKVSQIMTALTSTTIRGIVNSANEIGIKREDIVSLLKENGQFILVYFK